MKANAVKATAAITFPEGRGLLEAAVASSTNGIVIADATRPDYPLLYVNAAFETMTGYTVAEAVGTNCRFLQGAQRDQDALETLRTSLKAGTACHILVLQETDLSTVVREVLDQYAHAAENKGIRILSEFHVSLPRHPRQP